MSVPQTVAEVLSKHVVLEVESIDRMYLNVYVPQLQAVEGTLKFISHPSRAQGCFHLYGGAHHSRVRRLD